MCTGSEREGSSISGLNARGISSQPVASYSLSGTALSPPVDRSDSKRHLPHAEQDAMECHEDERHDNPGNDGDDVMARGQLERLHRVTRHDGKKIDNRIGQERAKEHRATQIAVGEEMHA